MSYYIPIFYNVIWFYFVLIELFEVAIELFGIALEGCSGLNFEVRFQQFLAS